MNPKLKFCAYDVIWVSIDPSFLLLDVNQLTGVKTKAAPLAEGVTEKRHVLGRIDDEGNDLRTPPPQVATMFATALNMEPDFVLAVMPAIRALWLKGSAAACWQTPRRRDFARDLRAPGGESKHAILLGILDDSDPDDRAEDTLAAAAIVAPWLNWTPKDCEEARREHRKTKPHK